MRTLAQNAIAATVVASTLLVWAASTLAYTPVVCSSAKLGQSYCSCLEQQYHNKAKYIGPLDLASEIRHALSVTSFRKEVIIGADTRVGWSLQTVARYYGAGYCHMLWVLPSRDQCKQLNAHRPFGRGVSCGFYREVRDRNTDTEDKFRNGIESLPYFKVRMLPVDAWWAKWFTTARAVMLGYNVMTVDTDTVPLADFYSRVKAYPASQYTMMSQAEDIYTVNGGFTYVQNASSSGPVAWSLMELMYRTTRIFEDSRGIRNLSSKWENNFGYCIDDQFVLTDTVTSAAAGVPLFPTMFTIMERQGLWSKPSWYDQMLKDRANSKYKDQEYWVNASAAGSIFSLPHAADGGAKQQGNMVQAVMRTLPLSMPSLGKEDKGTLRYPMQPPGPLAKLLFQAFKDLGVPLPPDPEDPSQEAAARATPKELYSLLSLVPLSTGVSPLSPGNALTGVWLQSNWASSAESGAWHSALKPPFSPAIGHVHAGSLFMAMDEKATNFKLSGHWDWAADEAVHGHGHVYYTSQYILQKVMGPWGPSWEYQYKRTPLDWVLAYAPGVIHAGLGADAYYDAVEALAHMAIALSAVAAWPAVPCNAPWALSAQGKAPSDGRMPLPWTHLQYKKYHPFGPSLDKMQCEWGAVMPHPCLLRQMDPSQYSGRGMLAVEFQHLLAEDLLPGQEPPKYFAPSLWHNQQHKRLKVAMGNLTLPQGALSAGVGSTSAPALVEVSQLLALNAAQLTRAHASSALEPLVLWVHARVRMVGMDKDQDMHKAYERWVEGCPALRIRSIIAGKDHSAQAHF